MLDGQDSISLGASSSISSGSQTLTSNGGLTINGALNAGAGTILLEANNDVTIGANLTTANETVDAMKVIAGKDEDEGTETGGDVIISGSPTISVGTTSGRATFSQEMYLIRQDFQLSLVQEAITSGIMRMKKQIFHLITG